MHLRIEWDTEDLRFHDAVDIRRVLICEDIGKVNRGETFKYLDIEYDPYYPKFEVVYDGLTAILSTIL